MSGLVGNKVVAPNKPNRRGRAQQTHMPAEYPEIIAELIKTAESDELRHFNLSSFMSDKPLEEVFQKIDRTMRFFTVYVFMELLEDDLWEDERYAEKEEVHLCSTNLLFYL